MHSLRYEQLRLSTDNRCTFAARKPRSFHASNAAVSSDSTTEPELSLRGNVSPISSFTMLKEWSLDAMVDQGAPESLHCTECARRVVERPLMAGFDAHIDSPTNESVYQQICA